MAKQKIEHMTINEYIKLVLTAVIGGLIVVFMTIVTSPTPTEYKPLTQEVLWSFVFWSAFIFFSGYVTLEWRYLLSKADPKIRTALRNFKKHL
jgi:hypothetical protein